MEYRIQYNYENGNNGLVESLFTSESFADALNTAEYYQKIYSYDRSKLYVFAGICTLTGMKAIVSLVAVTMAVVLISQYIGVVKYKIEKR